MDVWFDSYGIILMVAVFVVSVLWKLRSRDSGGAGGDSGWGDGGCDGGDGGD